jgi:hypothetical protein
MHTEVLSGSLNEKCHVGILVIDGGITNLSKTGCEDWTGVNWLKVELNGGFL